MIEPVSTGANTRERKWARNTNKIVEVEKWEARVSPCKIASPEGSWWLLCNLGSDHPLNNDGEGTPLNNGLPPGASLFAKILVFFSARIELATTLSENVPAASVEGSRKQELVPPEI